MAGWPVLIATLGLAAAAGACASLRGIAATECARVEAALEPGASLEPLAGDFALTLVATSGPRRGESVAGGLRLRAAPPGRSAVLVGTTAIALDSVGALRLGDAEATDPGAPGVAVYEFRSAGGAPTVTVRIGSQTTSESVERYDGGYTVLRVRRITPGGFYGRWESGLGVRDWGGHFCAVRAG